MANSVPAKVAGRAKSEGLGSRMSKFLRESYIEVVKKASWPSASELRKSTVVVILAVLAVVIYLGIVDLILTTLTRPLYGTHISEKFK